MASQVLSGDSNVSYTNNTGQNVRIVINYMRRDDPSSLITMSWTTTSGGTASVSGSYPLAIGRNLAMAGGLYEGSGSMSLFGQNAISIDQYEQTNFALPTELMLAPTQTFSATCGAYNIVVIPEAG